MCKICNRLISRREFLREAGEKACAVAAFCAAGGWVNCFAPDRADGRSSQSSLVEARFYTRLEDNQVRCVLCPRYCIVATGERGFCGARENREGRYYTLVYGQVCAKLYEPIEKNPFFHFYPGMKTLAIATACCNLTCKYCQSWQMAHARPEEIHSVHMTPAQIVAEAKVSGCGAIAYTYTEPVNFIEFAIDVAKEARKAGLLNICHTAAYVNSAPLDELVEQMDAVNIDLKAFTEDFYRDVCGGHLQTVLRAIQQVAGKEEVWLELTYLVIPTLNDNPAHVKRMCEWIKTNIGYNVPIHFSRFFPMYKLKNLPATPRKTVEEMRRVAFESGLRYAYVGNLPGHGGESTYCPRCQNLLIERVGYKVRQMRIKKSRCPDCKAKVPGVWG